MIYKDACYSCQYAQTNRVGDLTIGDFHVKDVDECDIDIENVSIVLVNDSKGESFLKVVVNSNYIEILERPLEEPIEGERQLRHPSIAGHKREKFLEKYRLNNDFVESASTAFRMIVIRRRFKVDITVLVVKKLVKLVLPRKVWNIAKAKLKK